MLTKEQNERFTSVGPGAPCGELMRRYWHPVAAVSQMKDKHTMQVRLLGEDLILYKDLSGAYGLIEPHCPHRRMGFIYGVPEARGLRCAYHGWLFDEQGRCLEMPYESVEDPETRFPEKIRALTYPVQEMAGLLFAYLGRAPVPLLPRWDVYAMRGMLRDIGYALLPCNWLQCQENSLDPVHVEWLHQRFANYVLDRLGKPQLQRPTTPHQKIGFDVFQYGIIKRRVLQGGSMEDTEWKDGHPIVFPNMLRQGGSGFYEDGTGWSIDGLRGPSFQIRTPIDDHNTGHWWVACYPAQPDEAEQAPADIPYYEVPVPTLGGNGQPDWSILDSNSAQDPAAWVTQGRIADRTREHLGLSDKGILLYRRMLEENIQRAERGDDPMNVFRDPAVNEYLPMRTERQGSRLIQGVRSRQGAATKLSPILTGRGVSGPSDLPSGR